jgi:hexosaminidase
MKKRYVLFIFILISFSSKSFQQCPIIPLPNQYEETGDLFILNNHTAVIPSDASLQSIAHFFQKQLLWHTGISVPIHSKAASPAIILKKDGKKSVHKDAYSLTMDKNTIRISAGSEEGIFYGVVSLLQLVKHHAAKETFSVKERKVLELSCWQIKDVPLYTWRGFMLDESRHFYGKETVKKLLDQMAMHKLNRFHWHLTDEPGWRLEVRQYPRLGTIGGIGNYTNPSASVQYYTQKDIEEIIAYASERFITVVPEIDMPGHATAANKAYPEYSGGGNAKHPDFTFHPGKEETYQYLANILKEVDVLFPSQMIHIGGDEVSFGNDQWQKDTGIQRLMKEKILAGNLDVEHYFLRRMADTITKLGNTVLGWDEVTQSGLDKNNTIVFWWRHDKQDQLQSALGKGYNVVLCPRLPLYFDFVQDSLHKSGRKWQGRYNALQDVYEFSVKKLPVARDQKEQILGIQANLWTETVTTTQRLDFMIFPRLYALAEAAWTKEDKKDYPQFMSRLNHVLPLQKQQGIYYYDGTNSHQTPEVVK